MYSFPNLIPLSPAKVQRVVAAVEPYTFDRIYSAWWDTVMRHDGQKPCICRGALHPRDHGVSHIQVPTPNPLPIAMGRGDERARRGGDRACC